MRVKLDNDVLKVLEFIQMNVAAHKLIGVASSVNSLAPMLWGCYEAERVQAIELEPDPICEKRLNATESVPALACVGGDSAAAADACAPK